MRPWFETRRYATLLTMRIVGADQPNKKPGAVSRPGAVRDFQFPKYSESISVSIVDLIASHEDEPLTPPSLRWGEGVRGRALFERPGFRVPRFARPGNSNARRGLPPGRGS
jgi:hypothetical protein